MVAARPDDVMRLIRTEYTELPRLRLTFRQAQRLWDLSIDACAGALAALEDARFLARTADGVYLRPDATEMSAGSSATSPS